MGRNYQPCVNLKKENQLSSDLYCEFYASVCSLRRTGSSLLGLISAFSPITLSGINTITLLFQGETGGSEQLQRSGAVSWLYDMRTSRVR